MLLCLPMENFTKIPHSAAELRVKTILKRRTSATFDLKFFFIFGQVSVIALQISICIPNLTEIT